MLDFSEFDMTGRVSLVTGAAGLLGLKHCEALLEIGYTVIATDLSEQAFQKQAFTNLLNKYQDRLIFRSLDVADIEHCRKINEDLNQEGYIVTSLINNAALNPSVGSIALENLGRLDDFNIDYFNKEIAVGLTGTINCSSVFGERMNEVGYGNILNIASDLSVIAPSQFLYSEPEERSEKKSKKPISYSAIKHSVVGVTKYLATYFDCGNVRCNALSPGGVYVDQPEDFVKKIESLIPMKRMAKRTEYKGAIKFLCSDASQYLNGQNIVMDGGRSIW